MGYRVKESIETDREGNVKRDGWEFSTYGRAAYRIRQRMKEIIKKDTLGFFRYTGQKVTAEKLDSVCGEELVSWLDESDGGQFCYVAGYLGWSCFWDIEEI